MPFSRRLRRSLGLPGRSFRFYRRPDFIPDRRGTDWVMVVTVVVVTIWSAVDGGHGLPMMVVASVGAIALMNVLAILFSLLPPTRLAAAVSSGIWVAVFMPAWDWLSGQFTYPGSLWSALGYGAGFGLLRWVMMPGGPSRPPW
jgi:hypothetical protein